MTIRRLALLALFAATPAFATGGFACRATDGSGLEIAGVVGHGVVTPLVGARLVAGGATFSTQGERPDMAVAQSWIDADRLWIDLVDSQALRFEARLRATVKSQNSATGTLARNGRTHPVHCELG